MNKSRKFAALTVIVFFLTAVKSLVSAQDLDKDPNDHHVFYAGFIGGANFCQIDGDNFAGYHKVGMNVGAIGYIQLPKHFGLSLEILYSQKGSKSNVVRRPEPGNGIDSLIIMKYGINANYAEIPVMLNYFDQHKSHIGMGFSYSRLVNSSETLTTDPSYYVDFNKYPFKKDDFQFIVGGQLHMWKGLFLNLRYQYSIMPIRTNNPPGFARSNEYNNMWTFRVMYLFM